MIPPVIAALLSATLLLSTPLLAQQSVGDQAAGKPTLEQLLSLMVNEIVMAPGVGLQSVKLGEDLESVKNRLGPPTRIATKGVLRRSTVLGYQIDGDTTLLLIGKKVVERIAVSGNQTALVRTVQGARFGMAPKTIQKIYRGPSKTRKNRLEFKQLGVTFTFISGQVRQIDIYPAG